MRKILFTVLMASLVLSFFASCENLDSEDLEKTKNEKLVNLTVKCKLDNKFIDFATRANATAQDVGIKNIFWSLVTSDNKIAYSGRETTKDSVFGKLSINCNPGNYRLVIFATKDSVPVTNNDEVINYTSGKVQEAYSYSANVRIKSVKNNTRTCTLKHCIARFNIINTCPIPDDVTTITLTADGVCKSFDMINNIGISPETITRDIPLTPDKHKEMNIFLNFFLPTTDGNITHANIKLEFKDKEGEVVSTCTFSDLPLETDHTTLYRGIVIKDADNSNMEIDTAWGDTLKAPQPIVSQIISSKDAKIY